MERLRVGLTALVLLLSGHGHSQADYVFPYRFGNLGSGMAPFSNPSGAAADVSRRVRSADAPEHRIQVFISSGTFITRLNSLGTGNRQVFEQPGNEVGGPSANPILVDLLNLFARQSSSHSAAFLNLGVMGIDSEQSNNPLGRDLLLSADTFVSDPFNRRSEVSTSDEALLASFGNFGGADAPARPVRAPVPVVPPADMLFSDKVGLSLVFFGLAGLATLGYAWRQRKSPLPRTSGGRRRPISPYRSPSLPNPRGTISSPPP